MFENEQKLRVVSLKLQKKGVHVSFLVVVWLTKVILEPYSGPSL